MIENNNFKHSGASHGIIYDARSVLGTTSGLRAQPTLNSLLERLSGILGHMSTVKGMALKVSEDICGYEPEKAGADTVPQPIPSGFISRLDSLLDDMQRAVDDNERHLARVISKLS